MWDILSVFLMNKDVYFKKQCFEFWGGEWLRPLPGINNALLTKNNSFIIYRDLTIKAL